MPSISEQELSGHLTYAVCTQCDENEAFLFLCGEGNFCVECFAKAADLPEEQVLIQDVGPEIKQRAKIALLDKGE